MADNNSITGSVVGKIRFNIDKKSWDNLELFQKKLASIKRQMSGMNKTIKVQAVVQAVDKVANATVKAEQKVAAARQKTRKQDTHTSHVSMFQQNTKDHQQALKMNRQVDTARIREHQQALNMNEKFNRDKQRQADRIARQDAQLKARGSKYNEGVEAFRVVKEQQLRSIARMRNWNDTQRQEAERALASSINQWRTGANGSIGMFRAQVNTVMRDLQVTDAVARRTALSFRGLRQELVQLTAAYTAFSVLANVAQVGMQMEGVRAAAKVFTGSDQGTAQHMEYLVNMSQRLGVNFMVAAKEFNKFSIAVGTKASQRTQRHIFEALSEYSTVLQVDQQQYERAIRAVVQMFSKEQIYAEELRGQLAEALPGSVSAMMRAAGFTKERDFFKAVEAGKIMASEVMPKFADELKKIANTNGALEATTKKTRAEMQRFLNELTFAKDNLFQNGMDKGLSYMFSGLSDLLQEMQPVTEALGNVFRGAITAITAAVKILLLPLRAVVAIFESFGNVLKELGVDDGMGLVWRLVGAGGVLALMATKFGFVTRAILMMNTALLTTMARLAPIIASYAVLEDMFLYVKYGDKASTVTGSYIQGIKQIPDMGVGGFMQNVWAGYTHYSPLAMMGVVPEYNVTVEVKGDEAAKFIQATVDKSSQAQTAATQSEVSQ